MKRFSLMTLLGLITLSVSFISSYSGIKRIPDLGACGAPGDPEWTCATCHTTSDELEVDIELSLKDRWGSQIYHFASGETYTGVVTIAVSKGQPAGYGFQAIALKAPKDVNGEDTKGFSTLSDNVLITISDHNREYVEHKAVSKDSVFRFNWTAPENGDGVVTFYACGNGVDLDGTNEGDDTACIAVEFTEQLVSRRGFGQSLQFQITPNPVGRWGGLKITSTQPEILEATVLTADGKRIQTFPITVIAGEQYQPFAMDKFPPGALHNPFK